MIDKSEQRTALIRDWTREILGKLSAEQRARVDAARVPALTFIIGQMILASETPREMRIATITLENGMTVASGRDDGAFERPSVQQAVATFLAASASEFASLGSECEDQLAGMDAGLPELIRRSVATN